jgi:uncharacterized protein (DUF2147 family)
MNKTWIAALALLASASWAQMTPVGLWKTVDDDTGEAKSLVRIVDKGGVVSAVVEKGLLAKPERTVCDLCTDARKDQPIIGMTIIEGAKADESGQKWVGGEILDPNNGKTYRLELMPMDGGKTLRVRGFIGPFYRTQVWHREP